MQRITKNTFTDGRNTDIDQQMLDPKSYVDAHNLTLVGDGKFLGIKDFAGTLPVGDVTGGIVDNLESNVKSVYGKYRINDIDGVNCVTNFITARQAGDLGAFYITVYDLDNNILYYLHQETGLPVDYFDQHRIVDARVFPENGVDYIYFSDGYSEMRQLRCEIPTGAADYFLTAYDLSLQRRGANGTVDFVSVTATGTLLSGTYQYAYRMVDPVRKKFTKWSSLTNPVHVYQNAKTGDNAVYSAVGASTNFAINLTITPTADELTNFDYYQLAVIENIYPVTSAVQPASLLTIESVSTPSASYTHKANEKIGLIPIEELVVDLAAIKSVKTLAIKQNRLFGGNVKYHNLEFDNGEPEITSGAVTTPAGSFTDGFSDHNFSSVARGHFRDETYRFVIVYRDKFGNKAPAKVLDLSTVTGNQIASGLFDVRFPGRNVSSAYTLFSTSGDLQSLGLSLTGIHNHPTWAVGFEIARAKRIKRILFQTPTIPMVTVTGIGALDDYPSLATTGDASFFVKTPYPDAQPQINSPVYVPKNLFWPEPRHVRLATGASGSGLAITKIGEAQLTVLDKTGNLVREDTYYNMVFPPASMYGDRTPYAFGGFEKLETVDYCIAKAHINNFETGVTAGDSLSTKISGTFASLLDGDYYFDSGWSGKTIDARVTGIKNYVFQDNLTEGQVLSGNKIMQYNQLSGVGINWGSEPKVQKNAIIETTTSVREPITLGGLTFANGVLNNWNPAADPQVRIVGSSGPRYQVATAISNGYINTYSNFTNNTNYIHAFRIANVINDIGDDRYGDVDAPHEFISTGASYFFTEAELANVQAGNQVDVDIDVFGGDCFVAAHTFKVADSAYSVVNQPKSNTPATADSFGDLSTKWGGRFYQNGQATSGDFHPVLSLPVAVESASQFIQIVLESEYNGGVMERDIFSGSNGEGDFPINEIIEEGALRSPLTYKYNVNISKQNDQKVYFTKQPFSFQQYDFKARIPYSDLKIYNSDVQGFDVFRVGNFYDLEENKGAITKLALAGDSLYGIQETGVVYLPTGQSQLQQTDAGILAVGTGDVIGRPIIIDQMRGGQHMNAVVETGQVVYIPDNINKNIYILQGQGQVPLTSITQMRADTLFGTIFDNTIDENLLIGIRDPQRKEFWLIDNLNHRCEVYSEKLGQTGTWMGNYEFFDPLDSTSSKCVGFAYGNNNLYLIADKLVAGKSQLTAHAMYKGDMHSMFGVTKTPRVSFVVNPDSDISKTFDNQAFIANARLATVDRVVEREPELGNQTSTGQSLDTEQVEGNYRKKTLRDSVGARLRGLRMLTTIYWKTGADDEATLSSVLTKYRHSARTPF